MTLTAAISGEQRGLEAKGQVCNTLRILGETTDIGVKGDSHLVSFVFYFPPIMYLSI